MVVAEHMREYERVAVMMRFPELIRPVSNRPHEDASGFNSNTLRERNIVAARRHPNGHRAETAMPVLLQLPQKLQCMKFCGSFTQQMRNRGKERHNAVPKAVKTTTHFAQDSRTFSITAPRQIPNGFSLQVAAIQFGFRHLDFSPEIVIEKIDVDLAITGQVAVQKPQGTRLLGGGEMPCDQLQGGAHGSGGSAHLRSAIPLHRIHDDSYRSATAAFAFADALFPEFPVAAVLVLGRSSSSATRAANVR